MARKVENSRALVPAARNVYPWDEWFDGDVWELAQGEDFHCQTDSFKSCAYQKARNMGIGLVIKSNEKRPGTVRLQAYELDEPTIAEVESFDEEE